MSRQTHQISPNTYARIAGLSYLFTIGLGIFSANFVESVLLEPENDLATVRNIAESEWLFRAGITAEILMYTLVILLAWSLYNLFKPVNRNLAFLALLWRVGEAIVGGATAVVSGLVPLLLLESEGGFEQQQLVDLVSLFLDLRSAGLDVVLIFIGLGGTLFCYLFYISGFVPRVLAGWGIATYISMLGISLAGVLIPALPESLKMVFYIPGGLFEITFGFWLLIKVDIQAATKGET